MSNKYITSATTPSSGGSGGGGGNGALINNQSGAVAGTPFNATYSKLNAGLSGGVSGGVYFGGDGGYASSYTRYDSYITGSLTSYWGGGYGATATSTPTTRTKYGDGGDGNGGLAKQEIVILRFSSSYITNF